MLKRNEKKLMSNKMNVKLQTNSKHSFWQKVKRISGKSLSVVNSMDLVNGSDQISNLFACNYLELYTRVSYDSSEIKHLISEVDNVVLSGFDSPLCNYNHVINSSDVSNALLKLKARKADGTNNLTSDALINSSPSIAVHISLLFSAMLRHCISPENMLSATLIPIPISTNLFLNDNTNYRAIALSSVLSKLLNIIIRDKSEYVFRLSDSQFGFKSEHSTLQCTFVVEEIIEFSCISGWARCISGI